jgi:hypothetical protein
MSIPREPAAELCRSAKEGFKLGRVMKALVIILMAFSCLSCSSRTNEEKVSSTREVGQTSPINNAETRKRLEEQSKREDNQTETQEHLGEQDQQPDNQTKKIVLQYRTAGDAVFSSGFVEVREMGLSGPVKIKWDLPTKAEWEKKQAFDELICDLEKKEINGVEFECQAGVLPTGGLRVTTVPQLTREGRERIKVNVGARPLRVR